MENRSARRPDPDAARPLAARLWIYQRERFPVAQYLPMVAAFAFSASSWSRACGGRGGLVPLPALLCGAATSFCLFLLLRLFDEFKDREDDARWRPYRPVPRGLVSLAEIRGCIFAPAAALPSAVAAAGIPHDLVRVLRALPRDPRHRSKIDYGALAAALAE